MNEIECLGQISEDSSQKSFCYPLFFCFFCFVFFIFLSLVEGNAEFQRLLENHIEILIICYQNNLKLSTDQIFKYFDKNWQSTY